MRRERPTLRELLAMLDARGLTEDTLVLFLVDNGWIQHPRSRGYAPRSKRSPYEGGVRTPILARWPGRLRPGVCPTPVSTVDVVPTVLAALNRASPTWRQASPSLALASGQSGFRAYFLGLLVTLPAALLQVWAGALAAIVLVLLMITSVLLTEWDVAESVQVAEAREIALVVYPFSRRLPRSAKAPSRR